MNSSSAASAMLLLLLLLLSHQFTASSGAIQCSDVLKDLAPCTGYLRSGTGSPSATCCSGISALASAATTSADRKAACSCLLSVAQKIKPSTAAAKALPTSCGISLPYPVSANIDCSKIN